VTSKTAVLDLDAELRRSEVTYKGATFEVRNRSELSIVEAHQFATLFDGLDDLSALNDADAAAKAGDVLQNIAALLVVDPPEGGFPDQACAAILQFWTEQNPVDPPKPQKAAPRDRQKKQASTGARSSQGSKRSTGATP